MATIYCRRDDDVPAWRRTAGPWLWLGLEFHMATVYCRRDNDVPA